MEPAFQESTPVKKSFSVLMCGQTNLSADGLADFMHVADHLGRRKLKGLSDENLTSRVSTDVLWMTPKKYWTVSKSATSMQDTFLDVADAYIANKKKDVVIVAPKDYGWINRDPRKSCIALRLRVELFCALSRWICQNMLVPAMMNCC